MQGNEVATGSAFAAIAHIESFHRAWVNEGLSRWGPILYRLQNLFFWPGIAVVTLSPLVAFFGFVGMAKAWKERPRHRWVLWLIIIPTAYFTIRSAVLLSFQPLGRFTTGEIALVLPYVYFGFLAVAGRMTANQRRMLATATIGSALAVPLWLGSFTFRNQGKIQNSLRPISPTSTNPPEGMQVAGSSANRSVRRAEGSSSTPTPSTGISKSLFSPGFPKRRWPGTGGTLFKSDCSPRNRFT